MKLAKVTGSGWGHCAPWGKSIFKPFYEILTNYQCQFDFKKIKSKNANIRSIIRKYKSKVNSSHYHFLTNNNLDPAVTRVGHSVSVYWDSGC